ncbi:MAG: ORF6N domain-containing protein [Muribaculaceae bacterium]|nr:ORF6N domain-containing protein [Muribaculaceae bacterium]
MNELINITSKIYELRGVKVMLDSDLAAIYGTTTGNLNKAVKRNIGRFPNDFMFQLNKDEWNDIKSLIFQNGIPKGRGGSRYNPYAFTEQGVAMLSSVLNSETAIRLNIAIMRAFVSVRQMLAQPKVDKLDTLERRIEKLENYIEEVIADVNDVSEDTRMQIELINESLAELQTNAKKQRDHRPVGYLASNNK